MLAVDITSCSGAVVRAVELGEKLGEELGEEQPTTTRRQVGRI